MDGSATERGFDSRIITSVSVPCMIAQTLDLDARPDRELFLNEKMSTIALQRQVRQNFAEGRIEGDADAYRYDDIGRLLFVPSRTPMRIKSEGRKVSLVRCMFSPATFGGLFSPHDEQARLKLKNCLNIKSSTIRSLLIKIAREVENQGEDSHEIVQCYGQILIIELKRYFEGCAADGGIARGGMSRASLRKVIERIEADTYPPTLDELSAIAGLSKRHLTRSFRQATGQTVLEKINESRFSRAMSAIIRDGSSISEVAMMSGFKSTSSFSEAYKKWFGKSPRKYMYK